MKEKISEGATVSECVIATGADPHKVKETIDQLSKKGLLTVSNRFSKKGLLTVSNRFIDHAVVYKAV
ncbi:MAG: hypothetical protein VKJ02_01875 [Snowella sp.]|nr:hypothetical protein [Snowella sp.]